MGALRRNAQTVIAMISCVLLLDLFRQRICERPGLGLGRKDSS